MGAPLETECLLGKRTTMAARNQDIRKCVRLQWAVPLLALSPVPLGKMRDRK